MPVPDWPGAQAAEIAGAAVVIGRLDALEGLLPASPAGDLVDAGRRRGDQLRLFLRRRAALRLLVGRRLGIAPAAVAIGYGKRGAPVLRAPGGRLRVSVSARGEVAGFALARDSVGIDLEPLADPGPLDIAFTANERTAIAAAFDPVTARLQRWTAKEAYLKALGTGFSRDPAGLEVVDGTGGHFAIRDGARVAAGQGAWLSLEVAGAPLIAAAWTGGSSASPPGSRTSR